MRYLYQREEKKKKSLGKYQKFTVNWSDSKAD